MKVTIDGIEIAAARRDPPEPTGQPLIATLHGGLYTGRYFDVPIPPTGSFVDLATRLGHPTVCFDRPGYGASGALAPEENTFERHAELLGVAFEGVLLGGERATGAVARAVEADGGMPEPGREVDERPGRGDRHVELPAGVEAAVQRGDQRLPGRLRRVAARGRDLDPVDGHLHGRLLSGRGDGRSRRRAGGR